MTPEISTELTGQEIESGSGPFVELAKLKGSTPVNTARGYAKVAAEFLSVLELLPDDVGVPLRPRAYIAAQTLECILKAFIVSMDKAKLDALKKPEERHDLTILAEIAEQSSKGSGKKLSIPSPDLPLWWEELAFLHGKPYLDRYPNEVGFLSFMPGNAQLAA